MKIEAAKAFRAYTQNSIPPQRGQKERGSSSEIKQDRVDISSAAQKSDLDRLVYSTAAEVEAKASTGHIQELKQAVAAGQYHLPADKLADALLSAYV